MSEEAFIYEAIRTPRGKQRNGSRSYGREQRPGQ